MQYIIVKLITIQLKFGFILEIGGWRQTVFWLKVQFITRYKKNGKQPHKYDTKLGFHI